MRVLFLTCKHLYLYDHLLAKISYDLKKEGFTTAIVLRDDSFPEENTNVLLPAFDSYYNYGREYFENNKGFALSYGLKYILSSLNRLTSLKEELINKVEEFNPRHNSNSKFS